MPRPCAVEPHGGCYYQPRRTRSRMRLVPWRLTLHGYVAGNVNLCGTSPWHPAARAAVVAQREPPRRKAVASCVSHPSSFLLPATTWAVALNIGADVNLLSVFRSHPACGCHRLAKLAEDARLVTTRFFNPAPLDKDRSRALRARFQRNALTGTLLMKFASVLSERLQAQTIPSLLAIAANISAFELYLKNSKPCCVACCCSSASSFCTSA